VLELGDCSKRRVSDLWSPVTPLEKKWERAGTEQMPTLKVSQRSVTPERKASEKGNICLD